MTDYRDKAEADRRFHAKWELGMSNESIDRVEAVIQKERQERYRKLWLEALAKNSPDLYEQLMRSK